MRVIISLIAGAILWVGMARQQLPESLPKHQFEPPEVISTVDAVYPFQQVLPSETVVLHVTRHSSKCSQSVRFHEALAIFSFRKVQTADDEVDWARLTDGW
jgi:hypothetical protein